jgi:carbonic anhydrase
MAMPKVLFSFIFVGIVAISVASITAYSQILEKDQHDWGYIGKEGPAGWSRINSNYHTCSSGQSQSPINISENKVQKDRSLPDIIFSYMGVPVKIWNSGHTIQVNYPKGSYINIGGNSFELIQLHFHSPSEHAFDGKHAEMEVHFVNKNENGSLVILGVLMKKGKHNKELEALFDHLSPKEGLEVSVVNTKINPMEFIPKEKEYFTYLGSLTTPPCSENVSWYVMKDKIEVSSNQIKKFKKIIQMNARPLQDLSKRVIKEKD